MKSFAISLLAFALIALAKGQMWYTVENVYMLEAAVIGTGGFILSLEGTKKPIKGSFSKTIIAKAIAAGLLALAAVMLPILAYVIPKHYGQEPWINALNVKSMISILLTLAGLVVTFTMCLPFTKYRVFAFTLVCLTVVSLSFLVPTSFVGGRPTSASMFGYDTSLGQNFFDCQFMRELFRPWNSPAFQNLFEDRDNFIIMGIFLFVALPLFFLIIEFVNKKILKNDESIVDSFINDPKRLTLKEKRLARKKEKMAK
jgi:hypothetical protein